jgi:DNA-directed RNA polymerase subunit M/transcription elongation factor TFIIS
MVSSASDYMKNLAQGTCETMKKEDFVDGVFCDRERWGGGDMHRRYLWFQCLSVFRLGLDCPQDIRTADPHQLTMLLLNFADHKTVPNEKALLETFERLKEHQRHLQQRARDREGTEQEVRARRLERQKRIRARADAQRAEERRRAPSEERYEQVINASSRELLKLSNLRPRVLLEFRMALAQCKFDGHTGLRRSFEHFEGGARILVAMVEEMLDGKTTSLSEYTMAHWKVICDKAMSKWRPYAKKSAAAVGLSEIRHMAAGTSLYKPVDGAKAVVMPLETLGGEHGLVVLKDVKRRLRGISVDDEQAGEFFKYCLARVKEIQSFRASLIASSGLPWVHGKPELALLVAAGEKDFSPLKHREQHHLQKADDYVELATMSPLGLLQLVTSFVCKKPQGLNFWQDLVAWREEVLRKPEDAGGAEKAALLKLLCVISRCPRCNSEKTTQLWRKTRSADEPFQFLICCNSCKAATVVE